MHSALVLVAVGASILAVAAGTDTRACAIGGQTSFEDYARKKGRKTDTDSSQARRLLYEQRAQKVREQNCRPDATWKAALNKFADWTHEELQDTLGEYGVSRSSTASKSSLLQAGQIAKGELPKTVDWSNLTSTKDIQDQGACGSCWAVAAASLLRYHSEIANGVDGGMFSVQQLVSCVPNPRQCGGKGGCKGATCDLALDYVMKKGLRRASEFPYEERDDIACPSGAEVNAKSEPSSAVEVNMRGSAKGGIGALGDTLETTGLSVGLLGFSELPENKLEPLMRALYEVGPAKVSISIPEGFHQYETGVMDGCPKNSVVTHGAVLIGYGEDSKLGLNYWKLQNSWGPDWGEAGRFRFTRLSKQHEENDSCGWDGHPEKGNGCIGGPSRVRVCGTCAILSNAVIPQFQGLNVVKRHDF